VPSVANTSRRCHHVLIVHWLRVPHEARLLAVAGAIVRATPSTSLWSGSASSRAAPVLSIRLGLAVDFLDLPGLLGPDPGKSLPDGRGSESASEPRPSGSVWGLTAYFKLLQLLPNLGRILRVRRQRQYLLYASLATLGSFNFSSVHPAQPGIAVAVVPLGGFGKPHGGDRYLPVLK